MKCICGFIKPTEGEIIVNEKRIRKDCDSPDSVGIIIETPGFISYYSGYKNLKLLADLNKKIDKEQKFTKPPVRFTDASLVRIMEEKGIGRPSTYATIISVLSKRKYTAKEGKYIVPTDIAFRITDMLVKYFPDVMDVSFTADMEDKLDDIENGGKDWHKLIAEFYPPFAEKLAFAATDGDEVTDILCEKCGAPMIRKNGS